LEVAVPTVLAVLALAAVTVVSGSAVAFGLTLAALVVGAILSVFVTRRYRSWGYAEREDDLLIRRASWRGRRAASSGRARSATRR
jgi:membrane protein YdbS with pleckstrin-like domain